MDNNFKGRSQHVLVKCSDIMSDHNLQMARHVQNLVGQCPTVISSTALFQDIAQNISNYKKEELSVLD